jgi:Fervidolysin N-terminal prodomain
MTLRFRNDPAPLPPLRVRQTPSAHIGLPLPHAMPPDSLQRPRHRHALCALHRRARHRCGLHGRPLLLGAAALLALLTLPAGAGCAQAADAPAQAADEYVPGEVIVKFQPGVPAARAQALLAGLALELRRELGMEGTYLVAITDGTPVPEMIERLGALPEVQYAEPNRITRLSPIERPHALQPGQPGQPGKR